jgi:transposase
VRWPEQIGHSAWYSYQEEQASEEDDEDGSTVFPGITCRGGAAGSGARMTQGEVAKHLSVPKGTIANWVAAAKHGHGPVSGAKTAQELENEIARLRKELAEAKQEWEVLKKVTAYFAKESQQGTRS